MATKVVETEKVALVEAEALPWVRFAPSWANHTWGRKIGAMYPAVPRNN